MATDSTALANGHLTSPLAASTSSTSLPTASSPSVPTPPEIESTLSRLSAYRNVRGVMILTRRPSPSISAPSDTSSTTAAGAGASSIGGIIHFTGSVFEGEGGKRYAKAVEGVVASTARAVNECDEGDELKFMRIRTKRHELIITPDEKYLLVVLQDPGQ
ncbi:hypothetical protein EHS25_000283 [Saitozyma podzolica]|uniref:Roadblock/LAMTOR2 domain-containing protein n=1 Tax=Saitozyma podzolica TaxID=1890683 RepID=A0A427YVS6_9TREE|nr:hypothetical protein EHS25_000283 [Saitozyma podzolica]